MFGGGYGGGHWHIEHGPSGISQQGTGQRLRSALDVEWDDDFLGAPYDNRVMKRVLPYMATVKRWLALATGGLLVGTLATLAMPYLVVIAVTSIENGELSRLTTIAITYVIAALLMWGGQYAERLYLSYAGEEILLKIRLQMVNHLHQLSLSFFDQNKVGKLMSRVQNDVDQVQQLIASDILSLLTSSITLIAIAVIMIMLNTQLALLVLTTVPVLGVVTVIWQKYARRAFIRARQTIAIVNDRLQENISGVRVTQSLNRERVSLQQFDKANEANFNANVDAVRLQAMMMPTIEILTAIAFGLVLVVGGFQVLEGTMRAGILIGFLLYIQRFFAPVQELTMLYTQLQRAMASGTRIFELLDVQPEIKDSPGAIELPPIKGDIEFRQVSFGYQPGENILHDINFKINHGETVAIVGQTGAGKSSLISLIDRFYEATKGEVIVGGYNVTEVTQQSLRQQIAIVPQDPFLFSGTIEDNIRYGRLEASHEDVIEAAKSAGAHDFIARLEQGYGTPVGERGGNLSAGQRQLICLARALLTDPPILILDEATSSVDTNTERIMQASLRRLVKERTIPIIAHRLSTVTEADRIIVLDHGRIVETGTHQELLAKQGLYYQMFQTLSSPIQEG
ncbi:MAG: ABC transporter ATP-binding protein [Dehalococcoidales bacterium]|nr:ABC transporter ATP-binding protein [Dehalococcoidales bacterium]